MPCKNHGTTSVTPSSHPKVERCFSHCEIELLGLDPISRTMCCPPRPSRPTASTHPPLFKTSQLRALKESKKQKRGISGFCLRAISVFPFGRGVLPTPLETSAFYSLRFCLIDTVLEPQRLCVVSYLSPRSLGNQQFPCECLMRFTRPGYPGWIIICCLQFAYIYPECDLSISCSLCRLCLVKVSAFSSLMSSAQLPALRLAHAGQSCLLSVDPTNTDSMDPE